MGSTGNVGDDLVGFLLEVSFELGVVRNLFGHNIAGFGFVVVVVLEGEVVSGGAHLEVSSFRLVYTVDLVGLSLIFCHLEVAGVFGRHLIYLYFDSYISNSIKGTAYNKGL